LILSKNFIILWKFFSKGSACIMLFSAGLSVLTQLSDYPFIFDYDIVRDKPQKYAQSPGRHSSPFAVATGCIFPASRQERFYLLA
jgi:hypothetical protein